MPLFERLIQHRDHRPSTAAELFDGPKSRAMRAMFANLTAADFGGRSKQELRSMERLRVHALFDEIQIAIYNDDHARLEVLMVKLALTTASHRRTN